MFGESSASKKRVQADLALLSVSIIWGTAFVVQRIAAIRMEVFLFTGLRFLVGALVLIPFIRLRRLNRAGLPGLSRQSLPAVLLAGFLLWGGAALQQAGLQYTTAGNAGFITGLYVVLIPIILSMGFRQRPRPVIWAAALLSVVGLFLLSSGGKLRLNPGDALELAGAVFWALHVILIGWLVQRMAVVQLAIGQYLVCAVLGLLGGLWFEADVLPALIKDVWVVAYTGVISVGLGYTLQAIGQQVAPPADAAIILSTEAIFAAIFGWVFLSEKMSIIQLIGCIIILAGILLVQSENLGKRKALQD
jgi:drug/metabolite transporter (DMT)-like permease